MNDTNSLDALKRAIELAHSDRFRRNRRQFFDWQRARCCEAADSLRKISLRQSRAWLRRTMLPSRNRTSRMFGRPVLLL